MKKVLFWIMYIPLSLILLKLATITAFFDYLFTSFDRFLDRYEKWSFDL